MKEIIYHANCADGFGAAWALHTVFGNNARYTAVQYDSIKNVQDFLNYQDWDLKADFFIVDFSLPREVMEWLMKTTEANGVSVTWLDHHKTAFEAWDKEFSKDADVREMIGPHFIRLCNTMSGAMLAWNHAWGGMHAPKLIQHIQDYDLWTFKLPHTKEFNKVLWTHRPWTFELFDKLDDALGERAEQIYDQGRILLEAHEQNVDVVSKGSSEIRIPSRFCPQTGKEHISWPTCMWDCRGHIVNAPAFLSSDTGHKLAKESGTFGATWALKNDGVTAVVSLRSIGDYDVSIIAKHHGGGGHKNAAGFSVDIAKLLTWLKPGRPSKILS